MLLEDGEGTIVLVKESHACSQSLKDEKEFFFDDLLVRIHFIIEMIWWTGLAL